MQLEVLTSPTCQPCKRQKAEIDEYIDNTNANIRIKFINIIDNMEVAEMYNISSVPALVLKRNEEVVKKHIGVLAGKKLEDFLKVG